jgi:hypothetical protein
MPTAYSVSGPKLDLIIEDVLEERDYSLDDLFVILL